MYSTPIYEYILLNVIQILIFSTLTCWKHKSNMEMRISDRFTVISCLQANNKLGTTIPFSNPVLLDFLFYSDFFVPYSG